MACCYLNPTLIFVKHARQSLFYAGDSLLLADIKKLPLERQVAFALSALRGAYQIWRANLDRHIVRRVIFSIAASRH